MSTYYPELNQRILEIAEGDNEFRLELTAAIHSGLLELKSKYTEGLHQRDEVIIQQIRHKVKPTIIMFEFDQLAESLLEGKSILESEGFGKAFEVHFHNFLKKIDVALKEVELLKS